METRLAKKEDYEGLLSLWMVLDRLHAELEPNWCPKHRMDRTLRWFEHITDEKNGDARQVVALEDGKIVGYLSAIRVPNVPLLVHGNRWAGDDFVIHPDYQNRGVGTALLKRGIEEMQKVGCKVIAATIWIKNKKALKFYGEHGFKPIQRIVELEI